MCAVFLSVLPLQTVLVQFSLNIINLPPIIAIWKEAVTAVVMLIVFGDCIRMFRRNPRYLRAPQIILPLVGIGLITTWSLISSFIINSMTLEIVALGFRFELWWLWFFVIIMTWWNLCWLETTKHESEIYTKAKYPRDSIGIAYQIACLGIIATGLAVGLVAINLPQDIVQQLPPSIAKPSSTHFHTMRTFATLEVLQQNPYQAMVGYGLGAAGPAAKFTYYPIDEYPLFTKNEWIAYQYDLVGEDLMIPENWFLQTALNGGIVYAALYLAMAIIPAAGLRWWLQAPVPDRRGEDEQQEDENTAKKILLSSLQVFRLDPITLLTRATLVGFAGSALISLATLVFGPQTVLPALGFGVDSAEFITMAPVAHVIDGGGWNSAFRLSGSFSTPNHFAAYLLLILPMLSIGWHMDKKLCWLYISSFILALGFVGLSVARFAWLGLGVMLGCWMLVECVTRCFNRRFQHNLPGWAVLFPTAFVAILIGNVFLHLFENQTVALLWTIVWLSWQIGRSMEFGDSKIVSFVS